MPPRSAARLEKARHERTTPAHDEGRGVSSPGTHAQPLDATIAYPGGLRARWRWGGSGQGPAVFALSEAGGSLADHGPLVSADYELLCRAELRIDGPGGAWTASFASTISDEPAGLVWDDHGLFVVKYGFHTYAFDARTGELRWSHRSATPSARGLRLAAPGPSRRPIGDRDVRDSSPTGRSRGGSPTATS